MQQIQFILYVKDQNASRDFYKSILNLEPSLDVPGMTEFILLNGCKLGLMPENGIAKILQDKTPHPSTGNGIPRCELYLLVEKPEEYFQRAIEYGAAEISPIQPRDWGHIAGYMRDPDGHVLAFACEMQ
ncbi:MAG: VOC family protein [Bacteroidota bacterium]